MKEFNRAILKPYHRDNIVNSIPVEVVDVPVTEREVELKKENDVQ